MGSESLVARHFSNSIVTGEIKVRTRDTAGLFESLEQEPQWNVVGSFEVHEFGSCAFVTNPIRERRPKFTFGLEVKR
jgi:hypothetical protein